jgi:hypothetical protein
VQELQDLAHPLQAFLLGTWSGLRCGWALVIVLVGLLLARRPRTHAVVAALVVGGLILLTVGMSQVIAADTGRSASMLWPAAVVGMLLLIRVRPVGARSVLPVLLGANLILPAANVVGPASIPVRNFHAEWQSYDDPHSIFRASYWLESGRVLVEQGQYPEGLHRLDIALQLDDHLVEGFVYRAIANGQLGNVDAAARDAEAAIALDPQSADAMYVRGTVYERQQDAANAKRLFMQALNASSPDWHFRADCIDALKGTGK